MGVSLFSFQSKVWTELSHLSAPESSGLLRGLRELHLFCNSWLFYFWPNGIHSQVESCSSTDSRRRRTSPYPLLISSASPDIPMKARNAFFFFFFYLNPHVLQISLLTQQEMSLWVMLMLLSLGILFPIKRLHLNNYPDLRCIWTMSPAAGQILNLLQPTEWKEEWI